MLSAWMCSLPSPKRFRRSRPTEQRMKTEPHCSCNWAQAIRLIISSSPFFFHQISYPWRWIHTNPFWARYGWLAHLRILVDSPGSLIFFAYCHIHFLWRNYRRVHLTWLHIHHYSLSRSVYHYHTFFLWNKKMCRINTRDLVSVYTPTYFLVKQSVKGCKRQSRLLQFFL